MSPARARRVPSFLVALITAGAMALPAEGAQAPYRQEDNARFDAPCTPLGVLGAYNAPFEALVDLDLDGIPDFVRTVTWPLPNAMGVDIDLNLNDGGGMPDQVSSSNELFSWGFQVPLPVPPGSHPHVSTGDLLTPLGRPDVLVVYGRQLSVAQNFVGGLFFVSSFQAPDTVLDSLVADLDGHGFAEIAVLLSDRVVVYTRQGSAWTGQDVPLPHDQWKHLDKGELTGDGIPDLLVVGAHFAVVRSLDPGKVLAMPRVPHGLADPDPAVGDIDGDSDDDVVLFAATEYRILRQTAPGQLQPEPPRPGGPATGLADVDGDGDLDGVCCGGGGGTTWPGNELRSKFEISLNRDGLGDFAPAFAMQGLGAYHLAGALDVDQDGDVDLVGGRAIYYSPGKVAPPQLVPAADGLDRRAMGDVDGDGDVDFEFGLGGYLANLGDGSLEARALLLPVPPGPPGGSEYRGPGFPGDFDGDGTLDLVVERWNGTTFEDVRLLANAGAASFTDRGAAMVPSEPFSARTALVPAASLVGDLDDDGDLDLVVRNVSGYARFSELWFNDGAEHFSAGPQWPDERVVEIADLTGDGLTDLALGGGAGLRHRNGLGGGSFAAPLLYPAMGTAGYQIDQEADFDAERDQTAIESRSSGPDILWAPGRPGNGPYSEPFACRLLPSGSLAFATLYRDLSSTPTDDPLRIVCGDVNDNGRVDSSEVLVGPYEHTPGACYGSFPSGYWCCTSQIFEPIALVDVDGDGDEDAVGERVWKNRSVEGSAAGHRLQFGHGTAGTGGVTPVLGVRGPLSARDTMVLHIRGGVGGAAVTLAISGAATERPDWPVPGVTDYVDATNPSFRTYALHLSGTAGEAGTGALDFPFVIPTTYAGTTEYLQVFVTDALTPGGQSASNALRIDYGH